MTLGDGDPVGLVVDVAGGSVGGVGGIGISDRVGRVDGDDVLGVLLGELDWLGVEVGVWLCDDVAVGVAVLDDVGDEVGRVSVGAVQPLL